MRYYKKVVEDCGCIEYQGKPDGLGYVIVTHKPCSTHSSVETVFERYGR